MPRPSKGAFEALRNAYQDRIDFDTPMPLTRGTGEALIADGKLTQSRVRCALAYHTDSPEYLLAVLEQDRRAGLDPAVTEPILDSERAYTKKRVITLFNRFKARIATLLQDIEALHQALGQARKTIRRQTYEMRVMQKNLNRAVSQRQQAEAALRKLTTPPKEKTPVVVRTKKRRTLSVPSTPRHSD
ncbi:MAG: ProQ/FINO family protein [Gammaproteobacteria bacterium]|jgi:sRNA-binding protein